MTALRSLAALMALMMIGLWTCPTAAADAESERAAVRVREAVSEGLSSFTNHSYSAEQRLTLLDGLLRRHCDPDMLAANILGRYWARITPAERTAFSETFLRYLVTSYGGFLKDVDPGLAVKITGAAPAGSRIRVFSSATFPSDPGIVVPVVWETAPAPDGRMVIMDVSVEGVSIIRAMQDDFASVLRSSGGRIEPLMQALQRKISDNSRADPVR